MKQRHHFVIGVITALCLFGSLYGQEDPREAKAFCFKNIGRKYTTLVWVDDISPSSSMAWFTRVESSSETFQNATFIITRTSPISEHFEVYATLNKANSNLFERLGSPKFLWEFHRVQTRKSKRKGSTLEPMNYTLTIKVPRDGISAGDRTLGLGDEPLILDQVPCSQLPRPQDPIVPTKEEPAPSKPEATPKPEPSPKSEASQKSETQVKPEVTQKPETPPKVEITPKPEEPALSSPL